MSDKQKIIRVKDWMEQQEKILLLYDNVTDMETLEEYLPNKGHIIITSRNYKIPGAIEVDVMTEQEAMKLLDNLLPDVAKKSKDYQSELKRLAKELDFLLNFLYKCLNFLACFKDEPDNNITPFSKLNELSDKIFKFWLLRF